MKKKRKEKQTNSFFTFLFSFTIQDILPFVHIGFDFCVPVRGSVYLNLDKIREYSFLKGLTMYLGFIQLSVDKSKQTTSLKSMQCMKHVLSIELSWAAHLSTILSIACLTVFNFWFKRHWIIYNSITSSHFIRLVSIYVLIWNSVLNLILTSEFEQALSYIIMLRSRIITYSSNKLIIIHPANIIFSHVFLCECISYVFPQVYVHD